MAETTAIANNHRIINLSSYEPTELKPYISRQDNWVLNGIKNKNYKYVIDRYKFSPTNATIIDSYSNYIYGKGLTAKYTSETASLKFYRSAEGFGFCEQCVTLTK